MDSSDVTPGTNAVADDFNNLRKDLVLGKRQSGSESDGATVTIDWSAEAKGVLRSIELGGNRTIAFTNPTVGQLIMLRVVQDSTGSRTLTWPGTIKWPSATEPTLTTTGNRVDSFAFVCTVAGGSPEFDGYFLGFDLAETP